MPSSVRAALLVLAAISIFASIGAASAAAVNVKLRVEGQTATHFSGTVNTSGGSVPGATPSAGCSANSTPNVFAAPNALTALVDAIGASNVTTSGTVYGWGVMLCSVFGEIPPSTTEGWGVRINQKNNTAPNGYVTATDTLNEGDAVVLYFSPTWNAFSSSLELRVPAGANPGVPVTAYVDSFDTGTDVKSSGEGVTVAGGGASGTTAADGSVSLTFPSAGKFLVTANKSGAVRGSAWITVDPAAVVKPVKPSLTAKQLRASARRKCLRAYRWHRTSSPRYKTCVRKANRIGKGR